MKSLLLLLIVAGFLAPLRLQGVLLTGRVTQGVASNAVVDARVTLVTPDLQLFREQRSSADGSFEFTYVGEGIYRLGVAALDFEYQERSVPVSNAPVFAAFNLFVETNGGRWSIIGNTDPELLDGTGSGSLLPTGEIFFCHDTQDPIMFDPISRLKWYPPDSGSAQGCHMVTMNTDGGMFLVGGSMGGNPQDPVVRIAKTYWRSTNTWVRRADMYTGRWYPGLVRLADERLLIMGGELNDPGYGRTNGCEIYDSASNSWTITGSFNLATEIPPALLLYSGEVLKTWRYPELYNPTSGIWRAAATMIQPRTGASNGDHADHEAVHLPDGRVMAVGIFPITPNATNRFCEFYNPSNNTWTLGPNPRALRHRPEALILPDGRVLAFGGQYSGTNPAPVPLANAGTIPNCTKVTDLYDVNANRWRPLADMNRFIHYHNVSVLVPDGRVIATGGAGLTANRSFAGDDSSIEAFEPPYLFRGVRPRIDFLSTTDFVQGSNFTVNVSFANAISKLVLVSARATTHWNDGGPQRMLELDFVQNGSQVQANVPSNPVKALAGYYILFAMVDDIPSVGRIVRVLRAPTPRPALPGVSLALVDSTASEPGSDSGSFRVTRTGTTNAPLRVDYALSGSALNGTDYNTLPNYVVIPAGSSNTSIAVIPKDDVASEGNETVSLSLFETAGYNALTITNVSLTLSDNDPTPSTTFLDLRLPGAGQLELTLRGPATRAYTIEATPDFNAWQYLTTLVNLTGTNWLHDVMPTNAPYLFFRARYEP